MWLGLGAALFEARDKVELAWFSEYHVNGIDLCRNTIVYDAMRAGCDWVFMIDADTFHRSTGQNGVCEAIGDAGTDIVQMIRDADRGQYPHWLGDRLELRPIPVPDGTNGIALIGAPVRGRGVGDQGVCVQHSDGSQVPLEQLQGKLSHVWRIGGACIAVNLKWFRERWRKGPWFEMEHDYSDRPKNARGEDYFICDGIWRRGGAVVCDGRFVPAHVDRRRLVGE
jgi:hypothetical protein